jgi:hypothetical protein
MGMIEHVDRSASGSAVALTSSGYAEDLSGWANRGACRSGRSACLDLV